MVLGSGPLLRTISRQLQSTAISSPVFSRLLTSQPLILQSLPAIASSGAHTPPCYNQAPDSFRSLCQNRCFATKATEATEEEENHEGERGGEGGAKDKLSLEARAEKERDPKDRTRIISWETSAEYMKSRSYWNTYGDAPVWKPYRRAHKGAFAKKKTRPTCIENGKIIRASACPICRDEYLVLDYRNTDLLQQFISPFTGEILPWTVTNLCQMKHWRMRVEMEKARYFGTMQFKVPFRHYNYNEFYGRDWREPSEEQTGKVNSESS